jgi:hypothetical protein
MTDNDLQVAKELGALQADMRTVKHDLANVSAKLDGLSTQISSLNVKQEKGAGFWAGIAATGAFIVTISGLAITAGIKIMGGH